MFEKTEPWSSLRLVITPVLLLVSFEAVLSLIGTSITKWLSDKVIHRFKWLFRLCKWLVFSLSYVRPILILFGICSSFFILFLLSFKLTEEKDLKTGAFIALTIGTYMYLWLGHKLIIRNGLADSLLDISNNTAAKRFSKKRIRGAILISHAIMIFIAAIYKLQFDSGSDYLDYALASSTAIIALDNITKHYQSPSK